MKKVNEDQELSGVPTESLSPTQQNGTPTQGEWEIRVEGTQSGRWLEIGVVDENRDGDWRDLFRSETFAVNNRGQWEDEPEAGEIRANARLMAAAPALYEALKESALAVHSIGAYHHPAWVSLEECKKELCVLACKALALVDKPVTSEQKG